MKGVISRVCTFAAVAVLLCVPVQACNIYFPANSMFSDEDLLVYGDGDPVYMSLREWNEIYGMHDIIRAASTPLNRLMSRMSLRAARTSQALQTAYTHSAYGLRTMVSVPEPRTPTLMLFGALLYVARPLRTSSGGRSRIEGCDALTRS